MDRKKGSVVLQTSNDHKAETKSSTSITPSALVSLETINPELDSKFVLLLLKDTSPSLSEDEYIMLNIPKSVGHLQYLIAEELANQNKNHIQLGINYFLLSLRNGETRRIITDSNIRSLIAPGVLVLATSMKNVERAEFDIEISYSYVETRKPSRGNLTKSRFEDVWFDLDSDVSELRDRIKKWSVKANQEIAIWIGTHVLDIALDSHKFLEMGLAPQSSFGATRSLAIPFFSGKVSRMKYKAISLSKTVFETGEIELDDLSSVSDLKSSFTKKLNVNQGSVHIQYLGELLSNDERMLSDVIFLPDFGYFEDKPFSTVVVYISEKKPDEMEFRIRCVAPSINNVFEIAVNPTLTVEKLKIQIAAHLKLNEQLSRTLDLVYLGDRLFYDGMPISFYEIQENGSVNIILANKLD